MAITYKVLAQLSPSSGGLVTLYTVPSSTSTVVSTISICNRAGTSGSFRVAVRPAAEAIDNKHYILYDASIPANDTLFLTIGVTLATTDVVSVYASSSSMSFNLFGSEIT